VLPADAIPFTADHNHSRVYDFSIILERLQFPFFHSIPFKHLHDTVANFQRTETPLSDSAKYQQRMSWKLHHLKI
jgi:hypothetical protein